MRYFRHFTKTTHALRKTGNKDAHLRGPTGYNKALQRWVAAGVRKPSGLCVFTTHRQLLTALCASFILQHSFRVDAENKEHQKLKFVPSWRTKSITTRFLLWYRFLYEHFLLGNFGVFIQIYRKEQRYKFSRGFIVKESSVVWNTMPCSPVKVNRRFRGTCHLHFYSYCFLSWLVFRLHGWRRHIPMKFPLTFNGLHGVRTLQITD